MPLPLRADFGGADLRTAEQGCRASASSAGNCGGQIAGAERVGQFPLGEHADVGSDPAEAVFHLQPPVEYDP